MDGNKDKVKGRIKEAVGAITGDDKLKAEGKADQAIGKLKKASGKVIDKTRALVAEGADKAKNLTQ